MCAASTRSVDDATGASLSTSPRGDSTSAEVSACGAVHAGDEYAGEEYGGGAYGGVVSVGDSGADVYRSTISSAFPTLLEKPTWGRLKILISADGRPGSTSSPNSHSMGAAEAVERRRARLLCDFRERLRRPKIDMLPFYPPSSQMQIPKWVHRRLGKRRTCIPTAQWF